VIYNGLKAVADAAKKSEQRDVTIERADRDSRG